MPVERLAGIAEEVEEAPVEAVELVIEPLELVIEPLLLAGVPVIPIGVFWLLCWPAPVAGFAAAALGGLLCAIAIPAAAIAATATKLLKVPFMISP